MTVRIEQNEAFYMLFLSSVWRSESYYKCNYRTSGCLNQNRSNDNFRELRETLMQAFLQVYLQVYVHMR